MEIQKNMATVIQVLKEVSGKSMAELSAELEISRSALQDYLAGRGNPSIATIDHLAHKLGVDASFLICGSFSHDQIVVLVKLLDLMQFLARFSSRQRMKFAELILEIISLMNEDVLHEVE